MIALRRKEHSNRNLKYKLLLPIRFRSCVIVPLALSNLLLFRTFLSANKEQTMCVDKDSTFSIISTLSKVSLDEISAPYVRPDTLTGEFAEIPSLDRTNLRSLNFLN